jgi:class 3 adenylate cyclase
MKSTITLFLVLFSIGVTFAQDKIETLQQQLQEATGTDDKMVLNYQLAEAILATGDSRRAKEAKDYGRTAYQLASEQKNTRMLVQTAYITAQAYERLRDDRNAEIWYRNTTQAAMKARDSDLIIRSVEKRSKIATRDQNYRRAYDIVDEAFEYFSKNGTSISELEAEKEKLARQINAEKLELQKEKDRLDFTVKNLRSEREQLNVEKDNLVQRQSELLEANKYAEEQISAKEEELLTIAEQKEIAEQKAQQREKEVDALSEEAAKQQLKIREQENDLMEQQNALMETELLAAQQRNLLYLSIGLVAVGLLLTLLFYSRYRSKRKANRVLEDKNKLIEQERQRSDELLLNILPAPIATELKEKGKAKAQKFDQVTVLFSDFINFTNIAEQMRPEELVEELDKCFKGFDFIISQYPDIEKIKTIGDAYMCASGLSGQRALPNNLVKAALQMQEFLDEQREERLRIGKPYFEARIGIHTGPVVAGVVGVKKFAYDIWGDTVNTAARVEANSAAGKVNISETTYRLVKYKFDCEYRGKVEAKNKGQIDMYFVKRELIGATVPA